MFILVVIGNIRSKRNLCPVGAAIQLPFSFHTQSTHHTTLSQKNKISNKIPTPKPGSPEHANSARCATMPDVPPCQMCRHARCATMPDVPPCQMCRHARCATMPDLQNLRAIMNEIKN